MSAHFHRADVHFTLLKIQENQNKMGFIRGAIATLLVFAVFWDGINGQSQTNCAQRFDGELSPTCFDPQGLSFQGVLFLITQNTSGSLPPGETVASYRQKVCQPEQLDFIIPCILRFKAQFTNTTCTNENAAMIDASGRQLLMMTEAMCMEPCDMNIRETLAQCFVSAQVNPDRYLNTSMMEDKFPLLGNTTEEATRFCQVRTQLFTCLRQAVTTCPSSLRRLYEMGVDVNSMQAAAELLCRENQIYMDAYRCFATPRPSLANCVQSTFPAFEQVMRGRMRTGDIRPSRFGISLCGVRLQKVVCELQAFREECEPNLTTLRTFTECAVLPQICKEEPTFQEGLTQMCSAPTTQPGTRTTPRTVATRRPDEPHVITKGPIGGNLGALGGSAVTPTSGFFVTIASLALSFLIH